MAKGIPKIVSSFQFLVLFSFILLNNVFACDIPRNSSANTGASNSTGDEVFTNNGYFFYTVQDIHIPGPGLSLDFVRSYNSNSDSIDGPMGSGWTHTYEMIIDLGKDATKKTLMKPDGKLIKFTPTGYNSTLHRTEFSNNSDSYDELFLYDNYNNWTNVYIVRYPNGTIYLFDENGFLREITDRNGNKLTLTYFSNPAWSSLEKVEDGLGRSILFSYSNGKITTIKEHEPNFNDRITTCTYNGNKLIGVSNSTTGYLAIYGYTSDTKLNSVEDTKAPKGFAKFTNEYDSSGRVISQKDGDGNQLFGYEYPSTNKPYTTITDARGNKTYDYYDSNQELTTQKDANNNVIKSCVWNSKKDLIQITDGLGHATNFERDSKGNITATTRLVAGQTIASYNLYDNSDPNTYPESFGNVIWSKDAEGRETHYVYDSHGNLLEVHAPGGPEIDRSYTYYSNGLIQTSTDANSKTTYFEYDSYGNLSKATSPFKNGDFTVIEYEYDTRSRCINLCEDPGQNGGVCTHYIYDDADRNNYIYYAYGTNKETHVHYEYNNRGYKTKVVDANGYETNYSYDAKDNLTSVEQTNGGQTATTSYTYDVNCIIQHLMTPTDLETA